MALAAGTRRGAPSSAWAVVLAAAFAALACSSLSVDTSAAPGVEFGGYRTFAVASSAMERPLVGDAVEREIVHELVAAGFSEAPLDAADFVVSYRAAGDRRPPHVDAGDPDTDPYVLREFDAGTVLIAVFDGRTRELIWQGSSRTGADDDGEVPARSRDAARAILAKFPPE
jgi:Domain of unknown function (DUF4136)